MKAILTLLISIALLGADVWNASAEEALRVFLRAGEKSHGPGAHDFPQFLKDWSILLAERGAEVDGGLSWPTQEQFDWADVMVVYAQNAGKTTASERDRLEAYRNRGGGLVFIHSGVCGGDYSVYQKFTGGSWEKGHSKWYVGPVELDYDEKAGHPVTKGAGDFRLDDEIYWDLHYESDIQPLARCDHGPAGDTPQMWSIEKNGSRTFVSIPGHWYSTFSIPQFRAVLMRAIAWAGHREVGLLTNSNEEAALIDPKDGPSVERKPAKKKKKADI